MQRKQEKLSGEALGMKQEGFSNKEIAKFCFHCGAEIDSIASFCPKCGVRVLAPPPPVQQMANSKKKNAGLAAVLSFLFVGFGQIYNGERGKGILLIFANILLLITLFVIPINLLIYFCIWVLNIHDAHKTAKKINAGFVPLPIFSRKQFNATWKRDKPVSNRQSLPFNSQPSGIRTCAVCGSQWSSTVAILKERGVGANVVGWYSPENLRGLTCSSCGKSFCISHLNQAIPDHLPGGKCPSCGSLLNES